MLLGHCIASDEILWFGRLFLELLMRWWYSSSCNRLARCIKGTLLVELSFDKFIFRSVRSHSIIRVWRFERLLFSISHHIELVHRVYDVALQYKDHQKRVCQGWESTCVTCHFLREVRCDRCYVVELLVLNHDLCLSIRLPLQALTEEVCGLLVEDALDLIILCHRLCIWLE